MRTPKPRNAPIDEARFRDWETSFAGYNPRTVTDRRLRSWINQFKSSDRDLAARVLDCVEFYSGEYVGEAYRRALKALPGWHVKQAEREGTWRFVEMSQSAGESGGVMLHRFRVANQLDGRKHDRLFISPSELAAERPSAEHTIVFLDDVVGTGTQVCDGWEDGLGELAAGAGKMYLLVVAAWDKGRDIVHEKTELDVRASNLLTDRFNFFSSSCPYFTATEREALLGYCEQASKMFPKGKGECGLGIVFFHRCPNVSIPVLHHNHGGWKGLFPRHV